MEAPQTQYDSFCTFAVTGANPTYQSIFICRSCLISRERCGDGAALCICQACANVCHGDCDGLEYIGLGPSYCDCNSCGSKKCMMMEVSEREAERLGVDRRKENDCTRINVRRESHISGVENTRAFEIDLLKRKDICRVFQLQAQELIKHSKETFWLDPSVEELCDFEQLALYVLMQHTKSLHIDSVNFAAEWWVQVKPVQHSDRPVKEPLAGRADEAIDLHYDKDEALAESFGIGMFPVISTVTYLTETSDALSPTVVFSRTYEDSDNDGISKMLVSHPERGKHLVFDGKLLHGAPSNPALRRPCHQSNQSRHQEQHVRVTFLVNIWGEHKPAGVEPLPRELRQILTSMGGAGQLEHAEFRKTPIEQALLSSIDGAGARRTIDLPFVGAGSTWEEDNESPVTLLKTYPPPFHDCSTLLVEFSEDFHAYIVDENDEQSTDTLARLLKEGVEP